MVIDADARGEKELRQPDLWRVSAQLLDASIPLGAGLPPVEKLAGLVRYGDGQLRSLALEGSWLGGPVTIESRRTAVRGGLSFGLSGTADATPLLHLLGHDEAASRVSGQLLDGLGTGRPTAGASRLPAIWPVSSRCRPFDKIARARFP